MGLRGNSARQGIPATYFGYGFIASIRIQLTAQCRAVIMHGIGASRNSANLLVKLLGRSIAKAFWG